MSPKRPVLPKTLHSEKTNGTLKLESSTIIVKEGIENEEKFVAYSTSRMVYTSVGGYGVTYHSYVAREFRNRKETSKGKES